MMDFPNSADLNWVKKDPKVQLEKYYGKVECLRLSAFNTEKPLLIMSKFVKHLNYAADKKTIISVVYQGAGIVAKNPATTNNLEL